MTIRPTAAEALGELEQMCLRDNGRRLDLGRATLLLALQDKPGQSLAPYLRHLDKLAREIGAYVSAGQNGDAASVPLDLALEALDQIFVRRYGYDGSRDVFDDPDGANMMAVIDNRSGLPVMLGAILIHVGRQLGWAVTGVNFPARFLVRLDLGGQRTLLDPFERLKKVEPYALRRMLKGLSGRKAELSPDHYRDANDRDVLVRILNNVKLRHLRAARFAEAIDVIDVMLVVDPQRPEIWREVGMLHARLDNLPEAIGALESYLRFETSDVHLYKTSMLIQELRSRLGQ